MDRYQSIFQAAPDGILLVDSDGVIREANPRAEELFGWSREELEGSPVERLVPPAVRDRHVSHRRAYVEDPHRRPMGIGMELRAIRKDGSEFPVEISLAGLDAKDEPYRVVVTVRDVTDRIRLRDFGAGALRAAEDERRRIARELHDDTAQHLATTLIHLRLAERGADAATRAALETIRDDLTRIAEGIRRIARGLRPPELEDAGLGPALRAHTRGIREGSGVEVALELDPVTHLVDADAQLVLYRVVQEALGNSVRHADAKEISVAVQRSGHHLVAEIRDDGRGFDVDAERRGGAGLGLMGMMERAASVSGHVTVESAPGQGTTVRLHLPIDDDPEVARG